MKARWLFAVLLLAGTIAPAAWGMEKLVVVCPHWEGVRVEIGRAFRQWYRKEYGRDIALEWMDQGGTSDDVRFVESLFKKNPEGVGIDVFFGGGVDPYLKFKAKNLLEPYKVGDAILKAIPPVCAGVPTYDPDYAWYGVVLSGFGVLYNKRALAWLELKPPAGWEDLGKPEYFSWVGAADPRHSGSMHMMYEIILQAYGWEPGWKILFALAGNTQHFTASASEVAKDTSMGEVALSLCIDSYALAQIEVNGESNMGFSMPQGVTVINPDAVGILKGAPNLENARRFIDFLLSYEGQLPWMLRKGAPGGPVEFPLNRLSIRPDVYNHPDAVGRGVNPYLFQGGFTFDSALASKRWGLVNDLIGTCMVDCHRDLRKAWKAVSTAGSARLERGFFELPVREAEERFYMENWDNPVLRNQYVGRWLRFSREKFRRIAADARRVQTGRGAMP